MARPKKGANDASVEERVETAFWKAIETRSLAQVSVSSLVREAGINRSTFYYHYEDIDDLARRAVSRNLPAELPRIALLLFSGEVDHPEIDVGTLAGLEKICMLIGHDGSSRISRIVEDALVGMWKHEFGFAGEPKDGDVARALEFLAGGIVGVLSRHGYPMDFEAIKACMRVMNEAFTASAFRYLLKNTASPSAC